MSTSDSPVRLPAGVRDYLPASARQRHATVERIIAAFTAWGYDRVITPAFECADVLERGLGHDARASAVRFVEPGSGEVVALRPDFTPQIARMVASRMADLPGPIRLCYEGEVTRQAYAGQREIMQAGVELIDASSPLGDAEVLAVASEALHAADLGEARLDAGHVAPARWVLASCRDVATRTDVVQALSRKDRAAMKRAAARLSYEAATAAQALVDLWGDAETVLRRAGALPFPDEVRAGLGELASALALYRELVGARALPVSIDLGELRGFDYYTGMRFAGYARGAGDAVLRGGRYDDLVGRYGRPARATGFAIDIEAVVRAQRAAELPPVSAGLSIALVLTPDVAQVGLGGALAQHLRGRGWRVAIAPDARPLDAWSDYVAAMGLDAAVVLGPPPHDNPHTVARDPSVLARLQGDLAALSEINRSTSWLS